MAGLGERQPSVPIESRCDCPESVQFVRRTCLIASKKPEMFSSDSPDWSQWFSTPTRMFLPGKFILRETLNSLMSLFCSSSKARIVVRRRSALEDLWQSMLRGLLWHHVSWVQELLPESEAKPVR